MEEREKMICIVELKNGITNSTEYCKSKKEAKYYIDNKEAAL
jgi:hypothetical protein